LQAHAGEHYSSGTYREQQELLIGKAVPWSTALEGRRGPQELLIGKAVPGSTSKCLEARAYFGALEARRPLLEPFMWWVAIL
jgi:hypothetical protein